MSGETALFEIGFRREPSADLNLVLAYCRAPNQFVAYIVPNANTAFQWSVGPTRIDRGFFWDSYLPKF